MEMTHYLKEAKRMNAFVKISLCEFSNWDVVLNVYKYIDNIKVIDLSGCLPSDDGGTSNELSILLPPDDQDVRWIEGLYEGKYVEYVILPKCFKSLELSLFQKKENLIKLQSSQLAKSHTSDNENSVVPLKKSKLKRLQQYFLKQLKIQGKQNP